MNKHKLGINENYLAKRRLKLTGPITEVGSLLVEDIESLTGVDTVSLDVAKLTLRLSYDASHRHLDDITSIVKNHDATRWTGGLRDKLHRLSRSQWEGQHSRCARFY